MAMNVKFLRGIIAGYNALAKKDEDTLYFCTDGALYLGNNLIAEKTDLTSINAAIQALQNAGYQNASEVGQAITNALANYYDKDAIDKMVSDLDVGNIESRVDTLETWKTALATETPESSTAQSNVVVTVKTKDGKVSGVVVDQTLLNQALANKVETGIYTADKANQSQKDADQDKALTDYKAEMVETLKGYQTTIPAETYDSFGSADKAFSNAKGYTDDEIEGLEFDLSDDGKTLSLNNKAGSAVAILDTTKFVKDGMISSVAISEDGSKLVITWNTDAGISATEIPLTELVDVMTGVNGTTINVNVSADDKISAEVKTGSLTDGHIASNAAIAKGKLASDVQASLALADSAIQEADLGDLASKDTVATADIDNDAVTADKLADAINTDIAKGVSAHTTVEANKVAWSGKQDALTADQLAAVNSGITTDKVGQYDVAVGLAATAVQPAAISDMATNASVDAKIGVAANVTGGPSGIYAAIQGNTNNTVEQCVGSINDITAQLTWGSF